MYEICKGWTTCNISYFVSDSHLIWNVFKIPTQQLGSKLICSSFTHRGDLEAIERISYEFVEDQARESVAYCETRFCPHLFLPDSAYQPDYLTSEVNGTAEANSGSKSNE